MAFSISLQPRLPKIEFKLSDKQVMSQIGAAIKLDVRKRTQSGTDVHGKAFKSYKTSSSKSRGRRGRNTGRVDLLDTGRMLGAITTTKVTDKEVHVGFTRVIEREKASYHQQGKGNLPKREFFGLSKKARRDLIETFTKWIKNKNRLR